MPATCDSAFLSLERSLRTGDLPEACNAYSALQPPVSAGASAESLRRAGGTLNVLGANLLAIGQRPFRPATSVRRGLPTPGWRWTCGAR